MANKEISIVLRAKNAMAAGLASAKESLQKVGKTALNVGKIITTGFLAGATALAGFAAKALAAYSKQEDAERKLTAALNAHGEAGEALLPMYREIASRIQDQTGVADELTLATMAQGRTLGVAAKDLEEYAKGVIALKSAGMEGASAQRAMAAAMQGNTEMLTRYLPELRGVTDEVEKQRIVGEFLARGYEQQKEQLNTVGGQWNLLKGRIGDVWEEMGRAIAQNGALVGVLEKAGNKVKEFGSAVAEWIDAGGFERFLITAEFVLKESIERVKWFGESFKVIMQNAFAIVNNSWQNTTDTIGYRLAEIHAKITGQEWNLQPPKMRKLTDGLQEIPEIGGKAYEAYQRKLAELDEKIEARTLDRIEKAKEAEQEMLRLAEDAGNERVNIEQKTTAELKAEHDKRVKDAREAHRQEQRAAEDAARARIKAAEGELKKQQDLAKMRVDDFVAAQQAERDEEKDRAREARQMEELEGRLGRGVRLSRRDMERLEAFRQIEAARDQGVGAAEQELKIHQDALEQLQQDGNRKLDKQIAELEKMNKSLVDNLKMG